VLSPAVTVTHTAWVCAFLFVRCSPVVFQLTSVVGSTLVVTYFVVESYTTPTCSLVFLMHSCSSFLVPVRTMFTLHCY
jgi:hypothetical protein